MDPNANADNPVTEQPGTEPEASLTGIMEGMSSESETTAKPEAKPTAGDNAEGKTAEAPAWTSQLPEDIRSNADTMKQLAKFQKIGELAKSYSELEAKLGKSITLPGKDATEEELAAFYKKIGKPAKAEDYGIDDKNAKRFLDIAFQNNLTVDQAKGLYSQLSEIGKANVAYRETEMKNRAVAMETALQKEYGSKYAEKVKMLERGVKTYGGPALGAKLKASGLLFDEDVVKMFIQLGEQSSEAGTSVKGNSAPSGYKKTSEGGMFSFKDL